MEERYVPLRPGGLAAGELPDLARLQQIAVVILKSYTERYYNLQRKVWESKNLEYRRWTAATTTCARLLADGRAGYVVKVNRASRSWSSKSGH